MLASLNYLIASFVILTLSNSHENYNLQKEDYYGNAIKYGLPEAGIPDMFTAMGPARLKMGKYNVPVGLYSEETILDLGSSGNHGFVE